jgi:hypothetical protein
MQITPTTDRWTKRSFLGIPLIGWALLVATGTALAVAVFWVTLGTTGTISVSGDTIDDGDFTFVTASESVIGPCSITITDATTVDIQATGLAPGDSCVIEVDVANAGAADAALQGFSLHEGFPQDGSVPGPAIGWDHDIDNVPQAGYCGTVIPASGSATIGMRIDANGGQVVPGASENFVEGDGFNLVPLAQYQADQCG